MADSPRISVIIPVYRVEPYLARCVDSVLNQTYGNLEILLVDDGSPDGCPGMCDEYARRDARVRVIHKENGGLSDARNAGLDVATGEYIGFVDSDDWVKETMYEALLSVCRRHDADIGCCGYANTNGDRILGRKGLAEEKCYTPEEAFREVFLSRNLFVVMWNKLYKRHLFDGVRFPVGKIFEDGATFYKLFGRANRIATCGTCEYFYRKGQGSITKLAKYPVLKARVLENQADCRAYIEKEYPGARKDFEYYEMEDRYYLLAKFLQSGGDTGSAEYRALRDAMRACLPRAMGHPGWGAGKKIKAALITTGLYRGVWRGYHWYMGGKK